MSSFRHVVELVQGSSPPLPLPLFFVVFFRQGPDRAEEEPLGAQTGGGEGQDHAGSESSQSLFSFFRYLAILFLIL